MLQIFMRPRKDELNPQVQFYKLDQAYSVNQWRLIGANEHSSAPLKINTEIEIYDLRLQDGKIMLPDLADKVGFLYVFDGQVDVIEKFEQIKKGDALLIENEMLTIQAQRTADLILFILDKHATFQKTVYMLIKYHFFRSAT